MKRKARNFSGSEDKRGLLVKGLLLIALLVALAVGLYFLGQWLEGSQTGGESVRGDLSTRDTRPIITYDGQEYRRRANQLTLLFMGVDKPSDQVGMLGDFRSGGQADFLLLMVIDGDSRTITRIPIDRDTMTEITVLGVLGNVTGTMNAQISLSHGFGDGKYQSGEFTRDAVSRLLYGVDIDFYVAMNLDAINLINDAVGGVTVTIEDDFTEYDEAMAPGATIKLQGEQAELFVRSRMGVGEGTNEARMARQQVYLTSLMDQLAAQISENPNMVGNLFDLGEEAIITDMKRGRMINEANKAAKYTMGEQLAIPGEHVVAENGFMEFRADMDAVEAMTLEVFYEKVTPQ